jgi:gluconate kinase
LNGNKTTIQERINLRKDHFMSPNLVDSQFAALESPLSEADVYPIEVFDPIERVVSDAVSIIDLHLLGNSRKQTA